MFAFVVVILRVFLECTFTDFRSVSGEAGTVILSFGSNSERIVRIDDHESACYRPNAFCYSALTLLES